MKTNTKSCWPKHLDCDHRDYIGKEVTLNGEPATIVLAGDGSGFAAIAPLDTSKGSVPYSWVAVFNICKNHDGKF